MSRKQTIPMDRDPILACGKNAPGRSRTCNLRFRRPTPQVTKPLINQPETHSDKDRMARNGALLAQKDARLAELADRWESLPEALKAGIFAMVKAAVK